MQGDGTQVDAASMRDKCQEKRQNNKIKIEQNHLNKRICIKRFIQKKKKTRRGIIIYA